MRDPFPRAWDCSEMCIRDRYTMYQMGLLTGPRTKSANVVGQTMHLNPHGDQTIYETMVRLAKGNESLLHPYVDSKGNFGKMCIRDSAFSARCGCRYS